MKRSNLLNRLTALGLTTVMFGGILTGCADKSSSESETTSSLSESSITEQIVSSITQAIQQQTTTQVHPTPLAFNPEDYAGNLDAFVYGLLISEYELNYNVFQAGIELPDGTEVFGIGYTDYADYYKSDDGTGFFPAGFLALIGEPEIPEDAIEKGLEITDLEIEDSQSSFVLAYECEPFLEHCVIWGQYLQYGVDEHGAITYQTEEYQRGKCNESLGTLYSFDEQKNVFDPKVGTYVPITGISLNTQIDFEAIEEEINRILENQDHNLAQSDIESSVYFAQEALNTYLLSLQTESFLGIPVDELIAQASALDPKDCIRITPDGTITVPLNGEIPKKPDLLTKWLVGASVGIVVASTIAVNIFVPASTPLTGAVASSALDVFMQVVVENHTMDNVNWAKVAVAATSGALLAWACPLAAAKTASQVTTLIGKEAAGKFAGLATMTLGNAIVSGATGAAMNAIDGKSSDEVLNSFLMGAAIGAAGTVAVAGIGKLASAAGKGASNLVQKTKPGKWLSNKLGNIGENVSTFINDHQVHLKNAKLEEILNPKSIAEATRSAMESLNNPVSVDSSSTQTIYGSAIKNKTDGCKREQEALKKLDLQHSSEDGYNIYNERYLVDSNGKKICDPQTGKGRRVDFVVTKDNKMIKSVEVTSETANKISQVAKENRILNSEKCYIINPKDKSLIEWNYNQTTEIMRLP